METLVFYETVEAESEQEAIEYCKDNPQPRNANVSEVFEKFEVVETHPLTGS